MMKDGEHMTVAPPVEPFELRRDPRELLVVGGDVRVEEHKERVAIAKGKRRIACQSSRGAIRRHELRHRTQHVVHAALAVGIAWWPGRHVVIARRKEERKAGLTNETLD